MSFIQNLYVSLNPEPHTYHVKEDGQQARMFAAHLAFSCSKRNDDQEFIDIDAVKDAYRSFLYRSQEHLFMGRTHYLRFYLYEVVHTYGNNEFRLKLDESKLAYKYAPGPAGTEVVDIEDFWYWLESRQPSLDPASLETINYWVENSNHVTRVGEERTSSEDNLGAFGLLKGASKWDAPIAHRLGLTHIVGDFEPAIRYGGIGDVVAIPYFHDQPAVELEAKMGRNALSLSFHPFADLEDNVNLHLDWEPEIPQDRNAGRPWYSKNIHKSGFIAWEYASYFRDDSERKRVLDALEKEAAGHFSSILPIVNCLERIQKTGDIKQLTITEAQWFAYNSLLGILDVFTLCFRNPNNYSFRSMGGIEGQLLAPLIDIFEEQFTDLLDGALGGLTPGFGSVDTFDENLLIEIQRIAAQHSLFGGEITAAQHAKMMQNLIWGGADPAEFGEGEKYLHELLNPIADRTERLSTTFVAEQLGNGLNSVAARLDEEEGAEALILRLFDLLTHNNKSFDTQLLDAMATATATSDQRQTIQTCIINALSGFKSTLKSSFNGLVAARQTYGTKFVAWLELEARLGKRNRDPFFHALDKLTYLTDRYGFETEGSTETEVFLELLPRFNLQDGEELRELVATEVKTSLALDDREIVDQYLSQNDDFFRPDLSPQPLSFNVAVDGIENDDDRYDAYRDFCEVFRSVGLLMTRLTEPGAEFGYPGDKIINWSHLHMADFEILQKAPATPHSDPTYEMELFVGNHLNGFVPASSDGVSRCFIDYHGLPFASEMYRETSSDVLETPIQPFVQTDVCEDGYTPDSPGFHPAPILAYGNTYLIAGYIQSAGGFVPRILRRSSDGWENWKTLELKSALQDFNDAIQSEFIQPVLFERRTNIGRLSIEDGNFNAQHQFERNNPALIGANYEKTVPLGDDYPKVGLSGAGERPLSIGRDSMRRGQLSLADESVGNVIRISDINLFEQEIVELHLELMRFDHWVSIDVGNGGTTNRLRFELQQPQTGLLNLEVMLTNSGGQTSVNRENDNKVTIKLTPASPANDSDLDGYWLRLTIPRRYHSLSFSPPEIDVMQVPSTNDTLPQVLLKPNKSIWQQNYPSQSSHTVKLSRVTHLDFIRWFSNSKLGRERFGIDRNDLEYVIFLQAIELASILQDTNKEMAELLDQLPDPSVDKLQVDGVLLDRFFKLDEQWKHLSQLEIPKLNQVAGLSTVRVKAFIEAQNIAAVTNIVEVLLEDILRPLDKIHHIRLELNAEKTSHFWGVDPQFVTPNSDDLFESFPNILVINIPEGHRYQLNVSSIVRSSLFREGIDSRLKHWGDELNYNDIAYGTVSLAIEVATHQIFGEEAGLTAISEEINAASTTRARSYDLNVGAYENNRCLGIINHRRLYSHVASQTQAWQFTGRPIYNWDKPKGDVLDTNPAVRFHKEAVNSSDFEEQAFFQRSDDDYRFIEQKLEPYSAATTIENIYWGKPSATMFRHRFLLRSRYMGLMKDQKQATTTLEELPTELTSPRRWTHRGYILADSSKIDMVRPQTRAYVPLTQGLDSSDKAEPPPIAVYLEEEPLGAAGLAERIAPQLRIGQSYVMPPEDNSKLSLNDLRREIGPDPRLSYVATPSEVEQAIALLSEGPIGLTYDDTNNESAFFANSSLLISPIYLGADDKYEPLFEEHFMGVTVGRYLAPEWTAQPADSATDIQEDTILMQPLVDTFCCKIPSGEHEVVLKGQEDHSVDFLSIDFSPMTEKSMASWRVKINSKLLYPNPDPRRWISILSGEDNENRFLEVVGLSLIHRPLDSVTFETSFFAQVGGRQTTDTLLNKQPLPLGTIVWSLPNDSDGLSTVALPSRSEVYVTKVSERSFLEWARINRDFNTVACSRINQDFEHGNAVVALRSESFSSKWQQIEAYAHNQSGLYFSRREDADNRLSEVALWPSTQFSNAPLHVHRLLLALFTETTTDHAFTAEQFAGARLLCSGASLGNMIRPEKQLLLRLAEIELPASILCSSINGIPEVYQYAYLDLLETGGAVGESNMMLNIRYPHGLSEQSYDLMLKLWSSDMKEEERESIRLTSAANICAHRVLLQKSGENKYQAIVYELNKNGKLLQQGRFDYLNLLDGPGLSLTLVESGESEVWADVSLLHSTSVMDFPEYFSFNWLFQSNKGETTEATEAVKPSALSKMHSPQARLISISKSLPIRITD